MKKTLLFLSIGGLFFTNGMNANNYYCPTCSGGQQSSDIYPYAYEGSSRSGYAEGSSRPGYSEGYNDPYRAGYYQSGSYYGDPYSSYNRGFSDRNNVTGDRRYFEVNRNGTWARENNWNQDMNWNRGDNWSRDNLNRNQSNIQENQGLNPIRNQMQNPSTNPTIQSPQASYYYQGDRKWHLADHELLGMIERSLQWNDYANVNIGVHHGIITLTGIVPTYQDKEDLKHKIYSLAIPNRVYDHLQVAYLSDSTRNDASTRTDASARDASRAGSDTFARDARDARDAQETPANDQEISRKINDLVKQGTFSSGYPNVEFMVRSGHVTVQGFVDKDSNRKDLLKNIIDIDGVVDIQSHLKVQPNK